jgi:choline kinase
MKSLTADSPKCLTLLMGRSLLDWQLDAARRAGFESIHIIGGFSADKLPRELVDFINPRWAETNMAATLFQADELLAERGGLVAYSDIVYRPEHLRVLNDDDHEGAILYDADWEALWRLRNEDYLADAESFQTRDGLVTDIGRKGVSAAEIKGQYMGLLKFSPDIWREISAIYKVLPGERRDRIDMTSLLRLLLEKGLKIGAAPVRGGWVEVDTEADRDIYEKTLREAESLGRRWSHDWRPER